MIGQEHFQKIIIFELMTLSNQVNKMAAMIPQTGST